MSDKTLLTCEASTENVTSLLRLMLSGDIDPESSVAVAPRMLETHPDKFCDRCREAYRANGLWWSPAAAEDSACDDPFCASSLFIRAEHVGADLGVFERILNAVPANRQKAPPEPVHAPPVVRQVQRRPRAPRPDLAVKKQRQNQ